MFVYSNLATSIDGKIATASREHFPLGTQTDLRQMMVLRREADAILMGATTLRVYRKSLFVSKAERQPLNVILSSALEGVEPEWPFFTDDRIERLLVVSAKASGATLKRFESTCGIHVLEAGADADSIARQVVRALEERGVGRLLIEGGGNVMWDFAKDDLIDEYHVTLAPRIIGGTEAPTLVDGKGFDIADVLSLRLAQCRVEGDEVYLVYRKTGRRGP